MSTIIEKLKICAIDIFCMHILVVTTCTLLRIYYSINKYAKLHCAVINVHLLYDANGVVETT